MENKYENGWYEVTFKPKQICPLCLRETYGNYEDQDGSEVQCPICHGWFELGFQTHSGD